MVSSEISEAYSGLSFEKKFLIDKAESDYCNIALIATSNGDIEKCFTDYNDVLYFWFDTPDGSTHCTKLEKPQ